MDQQRIGRFLKKLRNEKNITQEQLAEMLHVSNRTVSRWENGNNLPDLDILIEIADYYKVELREILEGERKSEIMNKELEETILKSTEYINSQTLQYTKEVKLLFLISAILWFLAQSISHTSLMDNAILKIIADFSEGATMGTLFCGILATSRQGQRIRTFKKRLLKRM